MQSGEPRSAYDSDDVVVCEGIPDVSVVVAAFNESKGLRELHRRVSAVCGNLGRPWEIVLVNDGSTDDTWGIMKEICVLDQRVLAVNLSRNFGQQAAITAGLARARGGRILIIDADLQDPPELLPEMLAMMDEGADVVYGRRRTRAGESWLKRATATAFYRLLSRWSETPIGRDVGEFKLLSRRVADVVLRLPEHNRFLRGLVSWVGFNQVAFDYNRDQRFAGTTHWPLRKMASLAIDAITGFSARPLELIAWTGSAIFGGGVVVLLCCFVGWVLSWRVTEFVVLLACFALISGVQLSMLAVLGAYVGRLYEESRGRPLFIESEIVYGLIATEHSGKERTRSREELSAASAPAQRQLSHAMLRNPSSSQIDSATRT